jgi:hypothetical protein
MNNSGLEKEKLPVTGIVLVKLIIAFLEEC